MVFVYLLKSLKDDEYYIGSTTDIDRRIKEHNNGCDISTKRYLPWEVIYYEAYKSEELARMREKKLKYNGNARKELMKRVGSPSTTFTALPGKEHAGNSGTTTSKNNSRLKSKSGAGFTMIELLVTVGIFALITSIVLVNYPKFASTIVLENVAHQVGLSVRQAQSYGLNVRGFEHGGGLNEFPTYGIHFSLEGINETDQSDQKHFLLFADLIGDEGQPGSADPTRNNKRYDAENNCNHSGGECVELFSINSVNSIYMLCGNLKSTGATIENWDTVEGANCNLSSLDIAYTRPDPDATITGYDPQSDTYPTFTSGTIVIRSPRGEMREVTAWSTGQIAVE